MGKTKAHIIYKNKNGKRVPGVTTILKILNKPALVKWANNLGLQGIDSNKYRDKMASIGTLTHLMLMEYLSGEKQDYSEYSKADIDKAENCLISFFEWEKVNKIEPILIEEKLVSEIYGYGGTIDCYCKLNGEYTLLDFKTGKSIYKEMYYQVAAYEQLLRENKKPVSVVKMIRIGRDEDEGFEDKPCNKLELRWKIFLNCLEIYKTEKQIKNDNNDFYNFCKKESNK